MWLFSSCHSLMRPASIDVFLPFFPSSFFRWQPVVIFFSSSKLALAISFYVKTNPQREPIAQKLCDNKYKNCITLSAYAYHDSWMQQIKKKASATAATAVKRPQKSRKREQHRFSHEKSQAINLNQSPKKKRSWLLACRFIVHAEVKGDFFY